MWEKWEGMECKESDPNRFDNRGGKRLKEEKERKKMARDLPKLEESIVKEISTWESETGRIFTVYGHKFADYLNNQKEEVCLQYCCLCISLLLVKCSDFNLNSRISYEDRF